MNDEWKDIVGFEGMYEISSFGAVRKTIDQTPISYKPDFLGYVKVGLYANGKSYTYCIHRLVAKAFIPNPQDKPQVHHINGNKTDNRVDNLKWCTTQEHGGLTSKGYLTKHVLSCPI